MPEPSGRLPRGAAETEATRGAGSASQQAITVRPPSGTRLRLVVYTGRGQEFVELAAGAVVGIGRGPENVVRLDDASGSGPLDGSHRDAICQLAEPMR